MFRVYAINNKNMFVETDDLDFAIDMAVEHFKKSGIVMIVAERKGDRWYKRAIVDKEYKKN